MWDTQWYVFIICKIHVEKGNRVHKIKNYKSFLYTFRAMFLIFESRGISYYQQPLTLNYKNKFRIAL